MLHSTPRKIVYIVTLYLFVRDYDWETIEDGKLHDDFKIKFLMIERCAVQSEFNKSFKFKIHYKTMIYLNNIF